MQYRRTTHFLNHRWLIVGLLLLLLTFVGCTMAPQNFGGDESVASVAGMTATITVTITPESATPIVSRTPTLTATVIPSSTATPTLMPTPTSSPTLTSTLTPTPLPTLTPLPTIPPEQRGQTYADLMSNNGGCELPCWWGFEMGATSLDEVRQFYATFDVYIDEWLESNGTTVLTLKFVDPQIDAGIQVRHIFFAQDGIVVEAEIAVNYKPEYQITPILQQLGQPSEVWVWTIPDTYEGTLPARFRLYFPEQGVFVLYGTSGTRVDDTVNICFGGIGELGRREAALLHLWNPSIWDPDGDKGLADRTDGSSGGLIPEGYPIDEVSNWDVEQFYTVLSNPSHTECLETPANLWPAP